MWHGRIKHFLRDVFLGDSRSTAVGRLHAAEDGMLTFLTVVTMLFFVLLLGFLANIAYVTRERVEVQNAADSAAYSTALWQSRGLNAVTAANHLMGELTAICVLHHAAGGPELDKGEDVNTKETKQTKGNLRLMLKLAQLSPNFVAGPDPDTFVEYQHRAGATLYDSRMTLQYWYGKSLRLDIIAAVLDIIFDAGEPLHIAATGLRYKLYQEWKMLDGLESFAGKTVSVRQQLESTVIPLVSKYADSVYRLQTPRAIEKTLADLSQENNVEATVLPTPKTLRLPLEPEERPKNGQGGLPPTSPAQLGVGSEIINGLLAIFRFAESMFNIAKPILELTDPFNDLAGVDPTPPPPPEDEFYPGDPTMKSLKGVKGPGADWEKEKTSQWVRATYPWVNSWRTPIRGGMDFPLMFSQASKFYHHWTNRVTLSKSWELRRDGSGPPFMFMLKYTQKDGGGNERWTRATGSADADQLFSVVAVVHRPTHTLASAPVFGQANTDGLVAYAQAMVYNANDQKPNEGGRDTRFQQERGWNTLNWKPPVTQSEAYEYAEGGQTAGSLGDAFQLLTSPMSVRHPAIQLNWQAKLTPMTRLGELISSTQLPANHRRVLKKLLDYPELNHH